MQASHFKGLTHGEVSPFAVVRRSRLVEGVAGVAIAAEISVDGCLTLAGMFLRLHHHKSSPLAQVQACTCIVEGTTTLLVEDHQRVEAIEVKQGKCLSTPSHDDVRLACLQHIRTQDERIGSRGTGGRDGGIVCEATEVFGHQTGVVATTVVKQILQMTAVGNHLCEVAFAKVHTSDGGARNKDNSRGVRRQETGVSRILLRRTSLLFP